MESDGCSFCTDTKMAIGISHLSCLDKIYKQTRVWHPDTTAVLPLGFLRVTPILFLKYAVENGCPWSPLTTLIAAKWDLVEHLKYVVEHGCPWHPDTTITAAHHASVQCLKYIYEQCGDVAIWEQSKLEDFETDEDINEKTKTYLRSVADSWRNGENQSSWIKPAK